MSTRPSRPTGIVVTRQPSWRSRLAASSTDLCSIADTAMCRRPSGVWSATPRSAKCVRLGRAAGEHDSRGVAPMIVAIRRRASSTASCAFQPHWWLDDAGLPKVSVKYGNMASSTRRSTGVVA
jgi:hypothetical protein